MSYWNYRVIKKTAESGEAYYGIYEAYYNTKDKIYAVSQDPIYPCGDTKSTLQKDVDLMIKAFSKPTLEFEKIKFAEPDYAEPDYAESDCDESDCNED